MTDLLNTYEKSFRKNNDIITSNFSKIDLYLSSKDDSERQKTKINKSSLLEDIDKLLDEQQKILKQMEIEICSLINRDDYEEFSSKLSLFKKNLVSNKKKYNELYLKEDSKNNSCENILLDENNNNLMNKERYIFQTNEKLQQVQRTLSNTENMGTDIIVNMNSQTKNMKNITGKIKHMGRDLKDSSNILKRMKKRTKKNKYIIIFFIIILILILLIIIGIKVYKKYK